MGKGGRFISDTLPLNKTDLEIQDKEMMKEVFFPGFPALDLRVGLRTNLVQPIPEA